MLFYHSDDSTRNGLLLIVQALIEIKTVLPFKMGADRVTVEEYPAIIGKTGILPLGVLPGSLLYLSFHSRPDSCSRKIALMPKGLADGSP